MLHEHKTKIVEWRFDEEHNFVASLYGCTECDETFVDLPTNTGQLGHTHTQYIEGCFGCKAKTLQLSTGDANSKAAMAAKKWDAENEGFANAVRQGINPTGFTQREVAEAYDASDKLGYAYNADTMVEPDKLSEGAVELMQELKKEDLTTD